MSQVHTKRADLPPGFEGLERFADAWANSESPIERLRLRQQSTPEELKEFYVAAAPMLPAIFEHLDRFPIDSELPNPQRHLYCIALGIIEAGQFMEVYLGKPYPSTFHSLEAVEGYWFGFTS